MGAGQPWKLVTQILGPTQAYWIWGLGPAICLVVKPPGNSDAGENHSQRESRSSWRTTPLMDPRLQFWDNTMTATEWPRMMCIQEKALTLVDEGIRGIPKQFRCRGPPGGGSHDSQSWGGGDDKEEVEVGLACLLQTWDHGRWKKTRVEPGSSNQVHAKRIFVCYLFGKTVGLVMEKFLRREKGWFWKFKKKKKRWFLIF